MKNKDDSLNELATAKPTAIHQTLQDQQPAAPQPDPLRWPQSHCAHCAADAPKIGSLHAIGPDIDFEPCTAPAAEEYIAELEGMLAELLEALYACQVGLLTGGHNLSPEMLAALEYTKRAIAKAEGRS